MKGFVIRCAVLAALGVTMAAVVGGNIVAANADEITIKVVMEKVNKGDEALCKVIGKDLKATPPKWDDLATKTKELVPLAAAMAKDTPSKGTAESWKKYSEAYAKAAVDLDKAVADKDAMKALAAHKVLAACMGCHSAHRGK